MDEIRIDHISVDVEKLTSSIERRMPQESSMSSGWCIFKIPNILYRHNVRAYVPTAFSIGPLHHGKPHLEAAEKIKLQYLHGLISRAPTPNTSLKKFIEAVRKLETEARQCYAEPIDFNVEKFVEILVVDGCFIIELLRKDAKVAKDPGDPVFEMSCMLQYLHHDLILLENQIPWLVLNHLYEMTAEPNSDPLTKLVSKFFSNIFSLTPLPLVYPNQESKHILDLLRNVLISSSGKSESGKLIKTLQLIPSAANLKNSGIKFKGNESRGLLDIRFKDGVLEISPLLIQETTEVAFRNLISFEQCYPKCEPRITSYAIFLQNLIGDIKDMNVLCESDTIKCWLNPKEATHLFDKLYQDTYVEKFYYLKLCSQVNTYCRRCWPRSRAACLRNHFGDPWAIATEIVGGVILVLIFLQTLYAMKDKGN